MVEAVANQKTKAVEPKTILAIVISNKMDKTEVVSVETKVAHPVYGKFQTRTTKLCVHDENNELQQGDVVLVQMSRPISKRKRWVLRQVVTKAVG